MTIEALRAQIQTLPSTYMRTQAHVALARLLVARRATQAGDLKTAKEEIAYARDRLRDLAFCYDSLAMDY